MIKKIFKKETKRPHREKAQILVKYFLCFDLNEDLDFESVKDRAIMDDVNKKGMKLTITPVFDRTLFKQIKKRDTFVLVEFSLPPDKAVIHAVGQIRWANNNTKHFPAVTELGIEFIGLEPEEKVMISRYVTLKKKEKI